MPEELLLYEPEELPLLLYEPEELPRVLLPEEERVALLPEDTLPEELLRLADPAER